MRDGGNFPSCRFGRSAQGQGLLLRSLLDSRYFPAIIWDDFAGWYIITYGLGIYVLNLLIGFLSPQSDPETEGPMLPTSKDDEFRPFIRRLPEFKFWYSLTKAFIVCFFMTFFSVFNIPVFWPILLLYFIALFLLTMKRQIKHMIKYKYIPFSLGKTTYKGRDNEGPSRKAAE